MWYIGSISDMQKTCKNLCKYFVLIHLVLLLFLQNKARETPVYETNQSWVTLVELKTVQTTALSPSVPLFVPLWLLLRSDQITSVVQSCPTLCDPMNRSTPGLPVHHQLPEFTQTHIHRVGDAIQPPHPLSSPSRLAPIPSQHQSLFQWVNSSHEVAKVLEFQL